MSKIKIFDKELNFYLYKKSEKEADDTKVTYFDTIIDMESEQLRVVRQTISDRISEEHSYHIKSKKYAIEALSNKGKVLLLTESAQEVKDFLDQFYRNLNS